MKSSAVRFFLILILAVLFYPKSASAYCQQGTPTAASIVDPMADYACAPWLTLCANPMNYLCCSAASECAAQNPFCNTNPLTGIRTGLGCIQSQATIPFINQLVRWTVSLASLAAFGLIIYSGFTMVTAQGDVKKVKSAQEILTAAIMGLILIVSAVVVLNFVGMEVLHLNFFGFDI
jgi:hypothetical protein